MHTVCKCEFSTSEKVEKHFCRSLGDFFSVWLHKYIYIYIFQCIFGRIGSSLLCMGFLCCGGWASSCRVFSYCRTRAPWCAELMGPWAQSLWHTALASLWHVGSSRTRYLTHVSCIARRILNHWATREAQVYVSFMCTMYVLP